MTYETLLYEVADGVATVTMNRPEKRNAVNRKMFQELQDCFEGIAADPEVRAFVLTGSGEHFCSGADLSDFENVPKSAPQMLSRMDEIHQVMRAIAYCPKPGLAAVRGYAAGGGANLALSCDLVVMTTDARFAELFVKRGLVVDMGGTFFLPRAIGLHRAKELALLGDDLSAADALGYGLANRVVDSEELDTVVKDLSTRLASGPPITMSLIKKAFNESLSRTYDDVMAQEGYDQSVVFGTSDVQEAVMAFLAKRQPKFTGE